LIKFILFGSIKADIKYTTLMKVESGAVNRLSVQTMALMAKALGVWAQDTDIKPDKVYAYILRAYENGKKVGEQGVVAKTSRLSQLYPPDVTTRRYEWGCALRWTNYDYYTAFNIYRNSDETGDFQKINNNIVQILCIS